MIKLFWLVYVIVIWFLVCGSSVFAWQVDYFVTKDGQFYCSEVSRNDFKKCIEFKNRITSKSDMNKLESEFVMIGDKGYCIRDGKELVDITVCDTKFIRKMQDVTYTCVIKSGQKTCTQWFGNDENIATGEKLVGGVINSKNNVINTIAWDLVKNGTCKVNGQIVPCDQMMGQMWSFLKLFGSIWIGAMILFLISGIFWLIMLIDAIRYETDHKAIWIIVMLFTSTLGAIIYYFVVKRPRDKLEKQDQLSTTNDIPPTTKNEWPTPTETVLTSAQEISRVQEVVPIEEVHDSLQITKLQRSPQNNTPSQ